MSLREKLEQLRGDPSEWIGGFPPPRINEAEWNALVDVALAAERQAEDWDWPTQQALRDALERLDKALGNDKP